ncbi:MAG TPA: 2-oxoglutarate dehydrogenase, E2 component, dihydrolipoamide succinyltransferase, partial [Alcanivorax sp.]|nr:2-oxoglutarate dehydrogenase, E2 component, dihydrolipoamide succinyltransferase [Alcanivorax sp.]
MFAAFGALAGFALVLVALIGDRVRATERRLRALILAAERAAPEPSAQAATPPAASPEAAPAPVEPAAPVAPAAPAEADVAPVAA